MNVDGCYDNLETCPSDKQQWWQPHSILRSVNVCSASAGSYACQILTT